MNRWLVGTVAVVGLLFLAAHASAQVKLSQRGWFNMQYMSGFNTSREPAPGVDNTCEDPTNYSRSEWCDIASSRGRVWNTFTLGKDVFATWMFEADLTFGVIGSKASSVTSFTSDKSSRGDIINIETGELFLDMRIPHTDFRLRGGQLPGIFIMPVFQDRTTGFQLYRSAGKARPNILFVRTDEKNPGGLNAGELGDDDHAIAAWVDIRPIKGLFLRPYWTGWFQNRISFGPVLKDQSRNWFGFNVSYRAKGWFGLLNFASVTGEEKDQTGPGPPRPDQDISAWSGEAAIGVRRGSHTVSFMTMYRTGDDPDENRGDDIHQYSAFNCFFCTSTLVSQIVSMSARYGNPRDMDISQLDGVFGNTTAGWYIAQLLWEYKATKKATVRFGLSHLRHARSVNTDDADGLDNGDDTHIGEALDFWLHYSLNRNLTFNAGTAYLIAGDALDFWDSDASRTRDSKNVWNGTLSVIYRF